MSERLFTEAPAAITIRFNWRGFDAMLTLRGDSGKELLDKMGAALDALEKMGVEATSGQGKQSPTLDGGQPDPAWCPVHGCAMKRREKDGQVWYSHQVNGVWCRGK